VSVHPGAEIQPGMVVYRLDDRLFFANAGYVRARIHEAIDGAPTPTHDVVFDAEGVSTIDASGLETLGALIDELADLDITFRLARARHHILGLLEDAGLLVRIGEPNVHPTIRAAARAASRPPE
jgi:SulP family sulfate permease